jgi:hypothetical protein
VVDRGDRVLAVGATCSSLLWWHSEGQRRLAQQQVARAEAVVRFIDRALGRSARPTAATGTTRRSARCSSTRPLPAGHDLSDDRRCVATSTPCWGDPGDTSETPREAWRNTARPCAVTRRPSARATTGRSDPLRAGPHADLCADCAGLRRSRCVARRHRPAAGARLQHDNALALQAAWSAGSSTCAGCRWSLRCTLCGGPTACNARMAPDDAGIAALIRSNIADALQRSGRPEETLAWLQTLEADPLMAPGTHWRGQRGAAAVRCGRTHCTTSEAHAEALPLAQAAADTFRKFLGPDNYLTLTQLSSVAGIHQASRNCAPQLPLARDVRRTHDPGVRRDHAGQRWSQTGHLGLSRTSMRRRRRGARLPASRPRARCACTSARTTQPRRRSASGCSRRPEAGAAGDGASRLLHQNLLAATCQKALLRTCPQDGELTWAPHHGGAESGLALGLTAAIDPLRSFGNVGPSGPCLILAAPILPFLVGMEKPAECPILLAPINVGQFVEIRFLL